MKRPDEMKQDPAHLSQQPGSHNQQGDSLMSVQPITSSATLVPATIATGVRAGSTTDKILRDTITGKHICAQCGYTAERVTQVVPHLAKHRDPSKPRKSRGQAPAESTPANLMSQAVALLIEAHAKLVTAPSDEGKVDGAWKTRALAAEKSLKSLRRILGGDHAA